jgi:hypothetical protein
MKSRDFLNQLNEYRVLAAEVRVSINIVISRSVQKLLHHTTYMWPLQKQFWDITLF